MERQPAPDPDLLIELAKNGYSFIVRIPGRGVCAIARQIHTVGLFYGMEKDYYQGRYCYETLAEALQALVTWDGAGDPPGDWIKHKGIIEYSNPNYIKE